MTDFDTLMAACGVLSDDKLPDTCGLKIGARVMLKNAAESAEPGYIFRWGKPYFDGERKGQSCKLLVRGGRNSALVEFEDGCIAVVSRNALRRTRP